MPGDPHVLICYDSSDHAAHAIARAAELVTPGPAIVLYAWQPIAVVIARSGFGALASRTIPPDDEPAEEDEAKAVADAGAELARAAGFAAEPRQVSTTDSIGQAILDVAAALPASLVVMGSRGLTGLRSLLLGSVSHEVVTHSRIPVLVVPAERHEAD